MKKLFIVLWTCLSFISCSKSAKESNQVSCLTLDGKSFDNPSVLYFIGEKPQFPEKIIQFNISPENLSEIYKNEKNLRNYFSKIDKCAILDIEVPYSMINKRFFLPKKNEGFWTEFAMYSLDGKLINMVFDDEMYDDYNISGYVDIRYDEISGKVSLDLDISAVSNEYGTYSAKVTYSGFPEKANDYLWNF